MKTIFDYEFKASRALGAYVPFQRELSSSWTQWNVAEINKAYSLNAIVFTCVHEIATSAAMVPFRMVDRDTGNIYVNPLSNILQIPNPLQDRSTFWECIYAFYLLRGNVGLEAAPYTGDEVREIYCIPFDNVDIKLNSRGMVNKYIVKSMFNELPDKKFSVSSITGKTKFLHLKTFNPDPEQMWVGMSPLSAAGRDADIFQSSGEWNKKLIDNAARPSGVFSYDDVDGGILTDDAYNRLKTEIGTEYVGASNAGTPILLEGGLKWQSTSLSPVDMDFLRSRAASARIVAGAYGYPAQLLGLEGDNTYNNQKEARLALWTDTVMPLCDKVATLLTTFFYRLGAIPANVDIKPNYEDVGALQPIRDAIWEKACVKGKDILTINERRELIGKPKIAGYDGIIANAAQVPLTYALSDPATRAPATIIRDNITKKPNKNIKDSPDEPELNE